MRDEGGKHMPTRIFICFDAVMVHIETTPATENWSSDVHTYSRDTVERVRERQTDCYMVNGINQF